VAVNWVLLRSHLAEKNDESNDWDNCKYGEDPLNSWVFCGNFPSFKDFLLCWYVGVSLVVDSVDLSLSFIPIQACEKSFLLSNHWPAERISGDLYRASLAVVVFDEVPCPVVFNSGRVYYVIIRQFIGESQPSIVNVRSLSFCVCSILNACSISEITYTFIIRKTCWQSIRPSEVEVEFCGFSPGPSFHIVEDWSCAIKVEYLITWSRNVEPRDCFPRISAACCPDEQFVVKESTVPTVNLGIRSYLVGLSLPC